MTTTKGTRRTGGVKSRRQQVLFRGFFDAISHLLDPGLIVDHGSRRARRDRDLSRRHFLGWWWEHLRRDVALAGERRGHGQDWSHYIISIVRECNKKKRSCVLLSAMYYDVQPRAQSVMRMCDVGRRRKRVILLIEEKRRGRTSPFFYPSSIYWEMSRERPQKKNQRERERRKDLRS